jgi:UDP-glucuronate decarboxylase
LDNLYSGLLGNIEHLFKNPNFKFIKHDVIKPFYLEVDEIYHLACPASPISYQFDPVYTIKTNILGSLNMLELAKKTGARVLLASTSEIYGDPLEHPQKEDYWGNVNPTSPRSCYDEGKRCAETLFFDYHREYNVDIKIIRIFNTYGPKMDLNDGRVVSNFVMQALRGEDLTVYGDGKQTRSFQYVDDLILGMVKMMESKKFTGPVNLGNPHEFTIKELAEKVVRLTGSKSKIIYHSLPKNDPKRRKPDISLAKENLKWEPKVKLEDGLFYTIKYFIERLKNKANILVFSTSYYPSLEIMDEAEENLRSLIRETPHFHFHIITARWDKNLPKIHQDKNSTVYRIGAGSSLDKYLLLLLGPFKAKKIHKEKKFVLITSIRATYAALAGLIFKFFHNLPFTVIFHQADFTKTVQMKTKLIWPIYKLIFSKTSAIHVPNDTFIKKIKDSKKIMDLLLEATTESKKIKETHHKIITKENKKLIKPK